MAKLEKKKNQTTAAEGLSDSAKESAKAEKATENIAPVTDGAADEKADGQVDGAAVAKESAKIDFARMAESSAVTDVQSTQNENPLDNYQGKRVSYRLTKEDEKAFNTEAIVRSAILFLVISVPLTALGVVIAVFNGGDGLYLASGCIIAVCSSIVIICAIMMLIAPKNGVRSSFEIGDGVQIDAVITTNEIVAKCGDVCKAYDYDKLKLVRTKTYAQIGDAREALIIPVSVIGDVKSFVKDYKTARRKSNG